MVATSIPRYHLYGESPGGVADRFIHIETIARRSAAHGWTIRPHAHAALDHLFVIADGGGEARVEDRRIALGAAMLTIPAGAVHGFRFFPGTRGHVITVAEPMMRALAAGKERIARLRSAPHVLPLPDPAALDQALAGLSAETESAAPLASFASEAHLHMLLIQASRLLPDSDHEGPDARARPALLVARYRAQVDRHLREGWSVADHARALATSSARLRAACVEVAGVAPIRMLHERLLAEARRQLSYTDRTIAAIGYDLGFEDPAYFSRFFRRGAGMAPTAWRLSQAVSSGAQPRSDANSA